ncbi:MAG TPA: hypothetical protein HA349_07165 [Methanotrichaceae archaeon]|nr:hypothetical protein [Methanotrichaceae archaeon]
MRANWVYQEDQPVVRTGEWDIFRLEILDHLILSLYTDLPEMIGSKMNKGVHSKLKITEILDIFSNPKIIMEMGY